jgi:hypothetical protein
MLRLSGIKNSGLYDRGGRRHIAGSKLPPKVHDIQVIIYVGRMPPRYYDITSLHMSALEPRSQELT